MTPNKDKPLNFKQIFSVAAGVAIIACVLFIAWAAISWFVEQLKSANPSVSAAIIGAMATTLVGVGVALYTQTQIKQREIEEAHRERKVEIYKEFLETIYSSIAALRPGLTDKKTSEEDLAKFFYKFKSHIMLWGSPEVIKAQLRMQNTQENNDNIFDAMDQIYKAIRKDIGLSNKGLDDNELIKLFLTNPSELDALKADSSNDTAIK